MGLRAVRMMGRGRHPALRFENLMPVDAAQLSAAVAHFSQGRVRVASG